MKFFKLFIGLFAGILVSCASVETPNQDVNSGFGGAGNLDLLTGSGGGGRVYKCLNHCGDTSYAFGTPPNQCFCDAACVTLGDCCDDYQPLCGNESCESWCGLQAPAGCWCDEACTTLHDCCPFKVFWCGT